ncbi:hypothetical protein, partial [Leptospira interrogans]|uniref:hypothetical protein n=1 Tax=Leptospira interrogans TaxID=173 RepID=UPI00046C68F5
LFQERSFKTFDQQTTVLRPVKEKPDKYVWLFAFLARVITERHQSYIQNQNGHQCPFLIPALNA